MTSWRSRLRYQITSERFAAFSGEQSPVDHSGLEGYDTDTTDALSASKAQFTQPPMVNETLTKSTGERYVITMVEGGDVSTWDMELTRVDV